MIKAIVFDFDGTIVDTETAWFNAFQETYQSCGAELTLETYSKCIGTSLDVFNPYEYINTLLEHPVDAVSFKQSVKQRHTELMRQEAIRPGIVEVLEGARNAGLKIGLASSSTREWVDTYLKQLEIGDYFECIRTSDNVKKVKPDPELYTQVLECLGVQGDEAIALEDSPNGARAAVNAGMHCIVIPNTITKSLAFDLYHLMADSLADLDFQHLISKQFIKNS